MAGLPRIAVLASGAGTNLQALIDRLHGREVTIAGVGGDKEGARAFERATEAGVPVQAFPLGSYDDRAARDAAIAGWLTDELDVDVVVLAGYMALLTPAFIGAFRDRIVNVHPSLLPRFPGLHAIEQAIAAGVEETGVTVHLVDEGVDTGPVLLQQALPIVPGQTAAEVRAALAPIEHDLLCRAVAQLAAERVG
ncbi:MAG: phosphoribosylglycinamide formyltransferase [Solirubrobacteraceae bacterium]|nr:phosphoribosylglycinamide formyltransferase [Solirubrobacteraceae bacterium]